MREGMKLTQEAEDDRAAFEIHHAGRGCTCFQNAPCSYCTDPGNPANQEEDDFCWEPECPIDGNKRCGASDDGRNCLDIYSRNPEDWKCPMVTE